MYFSSGPLNGLSCLLQCCVKISQRWRHPVSVSVEANSHASLDSGRHPAWLGSAPWSGGPDTGRRQTQILAVIPHASHSDAVFAWVSLNVTHFIPLSVWWHFEENVFLIILVWQSELNLTDFLLCCYTSVYESIRKGTSGDTDVCDRIQFLGMHDFMLCMTSSSTVMESELTSDTS